MQMQLLTLDQEKIHSKIICFQRKNRTLRDSLLSELKTFISLEHHLSLVHFKTKGAISGVS